MTTLTLTLKHWLFNRNSLILIGNSLMMLILLNTLPFERNVVIGLSILFFIAVMW